MGYKPSLFFDVAANEWKIAIRSKRLYNLLKNKYKVEAGDKTLIMKQPKLESCQIIPFISGIFDAEGWYEFDKKKYLRLRLKMKNLGVVSYVREELLKQDIKVNFHKRKDNSFVLSIYRKEEVKKFLDKFILTHPKWSLIK